MPTYDFSCTRNSEHRKNDITFRIEEYDEQTLKDKPCEEPNCDGVYEQVFDKARPGHSFKGDGWTPKFHR